ncbi:MAG: GNAT family N-acetyltransferase [Crocinitomicaceae bacterium]|nr:GNAT family N-acetyltransferase [Crocinitomicaceae bacterium]
MHLTTGWDQLADETVKRGLSHSLFCVCAHIKEDIVGMGRVIGDAGIYYYIQDVIVDPTHKNKGIGAKIMSEIETYLSENAPNNAFIGLMAAENVSEFYTKFGYQRRPDTRPGMFKIVKK